MGIFDKIKDAIPASVRPFLLRATIAVIIWELGYNFVLRPLGFPDHQLTVAVQYGAVKLLSLFYNDVVPYRSYIMLNGEKAVSIARQCNGLELIALYLGFIICLPTKTKRMLTFGIAGTIIIYVLNIIRAALLAVMYNQSHSMTEFAHHYVFKIAIYLVVFFGWVLYIKKPKSDGTKK
ncbi:MAG: archaeosortase/exosortase family protein [Chitinophagales bacterium]|nr:archaeosortase/exosortase family protein [Chitinophagales bacterium]